MKILISICLAFCLCVLPLSSSFADVSTFFELPCAKNELKFIDKVFNSIVNLIEKDNRVEIIDQLLEIL